MAFTTPRTWTDGELVTASIMNAHIRDNFNAMGPHLLARKTSDQSVTSSVTPVADSALFINIPANEIWQLQWCIRWEADGAGDIQIRFSFPTGGEIHLGGISETEGGNMNNRQWNATTSPTGSSQFNGAGAGSANQFITVIEGVYINGSTGGNVTLEWAQGTSNATATIIRAQSTLWGMKLA